MAEEQTELEKAQQVIQAEKERKQAEFQEKLKKLMEEYGVTIHADIQYVIN